MIYVVTTGSYSSYQIIGVYTNKKLAENIALAIGGGVEEYEENFVDDEYKASLSMVERGFKPFCVTMERDGTSKVELMGEYNDWEEENAFILDDNTLIVYTWATDEEHAAKIANEKRVQFLADNKWPEHREERPIWLGGYHETGSTVTTVNC